MWVRDLGRIQVFIYRIELNPAEIRLMHSVPYRVGTMGPESEE